MPGSGNYPEGTPSRSGSYPRNLVGLEIDDFEVLREIGRGGMGTVYQARQKSLNRIVALKVLSGGLGLTQTAVLRFQREAEAAARLHHSNITPIHAQGECNGVYYYAMELIRGENVHDLISRARTAAPGTAEPHPGGRDGEAPAEPVRWEASVEPVRSEASRTAETLPIRSPDDPAETVPLTATPGRTGGFPSVGAPAKPVLDAGAPTTPTDFEKIAAWVASVADALDYAHRQGVIHRDIKPHNLILGEDGRVYVLDFGLARVLEQPGVTMTGEWVGSPLYMSREQIMGGRRKVDKRTDIYSLGATLYEWLTLSPPYPGETREEVISKIITAEPLSPRTLNPTIPLDLETICLKALDKDPDRRYHSAAELRDDLLRFQAHEVIRAKRAGLLTCSQRFVLRNRVASLAAVALVVATVLSSALVRQAWRSRGRQQEIATVAQTAEVLEQKAAQLHETVKAKEEEITETQKENDLLRAMLLGRQLGQQVIEVVPEAVEFMGALTAGGGEADPLAQRMCGVFLDLQRVQEAHNLEARLGPGEGAANDLYLQALTRTDPDQANALVNECLRLDPGHVRAKRLAAVLACARRDYVGMAARAAAVIDQEPEGPEGYLLRGTAELFSADSEAGTADFSTALEKGEATSWAATLRGLTYSRRKEPENALRDFESALAVSPDNPVALLERGRVHLLQKNYEAAFTDLSRVIQLEKDNVEAFVLRGDGYDALGRYAESSQDYIRAVAIDPVSARIAAKLAQAIYKREKQQSQPRDAADTKAPAAPAETAQPASAPAQASEGGVERDSLEWLRKLLEGRTQDPHSPRGPGLPFRSPRGG